MKMSEGPDVRETQSELYRSQSALCLPKKTSECVVEELTMCCCNEDGPKKSHVKNVVMIVSGGLKREIDSMKATGSNEVGRVGEESNVMKPDEYTYEML